MALEIVGAKGGMLAAREEAMASWAVVSARGIANDPGVVSPRGVVSEGLCGGKRLVFERGKT